ncbi:MAG: ribonuclease H-like domain-containing protein, partial [Candidatus Aenigmarchaeota archaeon]|nr:ribonuclease H-like domain-containing protein [Candidatus Aenigmarchaeota archaeon]
MLYPIHADYEISDGKAVIKISGRDEKGNKIVFEDRNYEPHLYAIPEQDKIEEVKKRIEKLEVEHNEIIISVKKVEIVERIDLNKKMKALKIICHLPRDAPLLKDDVRNTEGVLHKREFDIPFAKRYCLDKQINFFAPYKIENNKFEKQEGKLYQPKVAAFDIETYAPTFDAKENKIICIGIHGKDKKSVITWKSSNLKEAIVVKDEKEMLREFFKMIGEYDILISYNGDNFDLPFLKTRSDELKLKSPISLTKTRANFKNGLHIDLYNIIAKHLRAEVKTRTKKLDDIAKFFLGEGKTDIKLFENNLGKDIWDSDEVSRIDEILKYNLQDCRITYLIGEKILPLEYRFSNLIGVSMQDTTRSGFSQLVESYLMREVVKKGI